MLLTPQLPQNRVVHGIDQPTVFEPKLKRFPQR
jgi:hypothetical protein